MNDKQIKEILENSKTIAMIGVSSEKKGEDPKNLKRKPANVVMKYMQDFGYKVYPINPFAEGEIINGEKVIKSLDNIYMTSTKFYISTFTSNPLEMSLLFIYCASLACFSSY